MKSRGPKRSSTIDRVLSALREKACRVEGTGPRYRAQCPAHDDTNPSLSIGVGDDGKVLLKCHAGCSTESVLRALGLRTRDLWKPGSRSKRLRKPTPSRPSADTSQESATYTYRDAQGTPVREVLRRPGKRFSQLGIKPNGARVFGPGATKDLPDLPYRLPEVLRATRDGRRILICEGEKDVDAGVAHGCVATCNAGGAGKWRDTHSKHLRGAREVWIIADKDQAGYQHALQVRDSLKRIAGLDSLVFEAKDGKDLSDHFGAGLKLKDLVDIDPETKLAPDVSGLLVSPEEFLQDRAPAWIVKGLIYEASTHNLTGVTKVGKTWFALQLAMCVASGRPFLGLHVKSCPVLYISLELTAGMLRERMFNLADDVKLRRPPYKGLHIVAHTRDRLIQLNLHRDEGEAALRALVAETGARLVVFDTLYRFIPGEDPNDNAQMGELFGWFNDLAHKTGAALLFLDHASKGPASGPVSHSALGAQVKGGASRVVIGIQRLRGAEGGSWSLDVESHFGSWERPIHYMRPRHPSGEYGFGCVRCTADEAQRLAHDDLKRVFDAHGELDSQGRRFFASGKKFMDALQVEGLASKNRDEMQKMKARIKKLHCTPEEPAGPASTEQTESLKMKALISKVHSTPGDPASEPEAPILIGKGRRGADTFTWRAERANVHPRKLFIRQGTHRS